MGSRVIPSTFVKNVAQNGIGRHVCQLQRITLSFCKSHPGSLEAREFIENYMVDFSKANPGIVVYLKPRRHRIPMIQADYLNGYSEQLSLKGCDKDMIAQWMGHLKGRSGVQIKRLRKDWHTDNPSIQGVWSPFTFKDTKLNVADLRDKKLSEHVTMYRTATEKVMEILEEGRDLPKKEQCTDTIISVSSDIKSEQTEDVSEEALRDTNNEQI